MLLSTVNSASIVVVVVDGAVGCRRITSVERCLTRKSIRRAQISTTAYVRKKKKKAVICYGLLKTGLPPNLSLAQAAPFQYV